MKRVLLSIAAVTVGLAIFAGPAVACGGLVGENGSIQLVRTATLAAYHEQIRALVADWDRVMRALASRESDLQGVFVQEDKVVAILDQALAGGNAQGLHSALAETPQLLDNSDHYLSNAQVIFGDLSSDTPAISDVFSRLASVMSGKGPQGENMWRVYAVAGQGTVSLP